MGLLNQRVTAARGPTGEWKKEAFGAAAVALITAVVFGSVLQNGFVAWDDRSNFLTNPFYRGLGLPQLKWMWTTFHRGHYVPLSWMTLGADFLLHGMNPRGYHFTNLVLHALNAALVFAVARLLFARAAPDFSGGRGRIAAAATALFFSLHPLRVESVAWITERRDVLGAFFLLASAACYLQRFRGGASRAWTGGALVLYFFSLTAKSLGMVFPAVLLLLDHFPLDRWRTATERRTLLLEKIPYAFLALGAAVLAARAQIDANAALPLDRYPLVHRLAQMGYGGIFYLQKTLWPHPLAALYPFPAEGPAAPALLMRGAGTACLTMAALRSLSRRPGPAVAWLIYLVFFLPTSGIFQSGGQFVADRYSYLACLPWAFGFGRWVVRGTAGGRNGRFGVAAAAMGVLTAAAFLTHRQIATWRDGGTLWTQVAAVNPDSANAALTAAQWSLEAGRLKDAAAAADRALRLTPEDAVTLHLAGHIDLLLGRSSAVPRLEEARRRDPALAGLADSLAAAYFERGRFREAEGLFRESAAREPRSAPAWYNVGLALFRQGRWGAAREMFDRVLEIDPRHAGARDFRAECLRREKSPVPGPANVLLKNP